jgi:hypothetical protein
LNSPPGSAIGPKFGNTRKINNRMTTTTTRIRTKNFVDEKSKAVTKIFIKNTIIQKLPYHATGLGTSNCNNQSINEVISNGQKKIILG